MADLNLAFLIMVLDYPLLALAQILHGSLDRLSQHFWKLYLSIAGTVMYVVAGALLGYVCDRIRLRFKHAT
jgi:hypothetical protein